MPTDFGGIKSLFEDAICPVPSGSPSYSAQMNGENIPDGQMRTSPGDLPEVTFDKGIDDAPSPGSALGISGVDKRSNNPFGG